MDGRIWHRAKANLGSRNSRKRNTKNNFWKKGAQSARSRVRLEYETLLKQQ